MYPSTIDVMMRKHVFILLVNLLSFQLTVFAQQSVSVDVKIHSDSTIVVRELFDNCRLYGDIITVDTDKKQGRKSEDGSQKDSREYKRYGGEKDRFSNKMKSLNKNNIVDYITNKELGICIKIKYNEIQDDSLKILFYGAKYDSVLKQKTNKAGKQYWGSEEWIPNQNLIYIVNIKKITEDQAIKRGVDSIPLPPKDSTNISNKNHSLIYKIQKDIIFIVLIALLFIIVIIHKINTRVKKLEAERMQSPPISENISLDKIRKTVISNIQSKDLVQIISNNDIFDSINRPEIQSHIKAIITEKTVNYLSNNLQDDLKNMIEDYLRNLGLSTISNMAQSIQKSNIGQSTTKVDYLADNNCFVINENSQNKIFEIYSIDGEYYYTIVKDDSIRKEMLGFITAYSKCIDIIPDPQMPSIVEVISDGRLIKNGDMYVVDTNHLLQVSLR